MAELTMLARDVPPDLMEFFEPVTFGGQTDVFTIPTQSTSFAHFATYPRELVRRCVLAGCPAKVCAVCGAPWVREVELAERVQAHWLGTEQVKAKTAKGKHGATSVIETGSYQTYRSVGFRPTCGCSAATRPGLVCDPFMGSGTTALVARDNGRDYVGCDLNAEYVKLSRERLRMPFEAHHMVKETRYDDLPLFAASPSG